MKRRILALLLTVVMLLSMLPTQVFAAQTETATTEQTQQSTQSQQTPESTESQETEKDPVKTTQTISSRNELLASIDYDAAMTDLAYLTQTIGTRPTGSIGEHMAAEYVASVFEELGYETTIQEFPTTKNGYWPGTMGEVYLGDLTLSAFTPTSNTYYTAFGHAEGTAVYLDDPANVASLGSDLSGKIVFYPGNWRSGKDPDTISCMQALDAAGAEAIVILLDHTIDPGEASNVWFPTLSLTASTTVSTPVLLCNNYEYDRVPAYLAQNPGITASVDCRDSDIHTHNTVGVKKAAVETDWTVYVCGHMDSVMPGSGTNDNASGTVGVLALARAFQNVETNYNIVFITLGAEEIGLEGSEYFVRNMTAEEKDHAIGVYNMDMIATSYPGCDYIYMMVPTNDFSLTDNVVENRVVLSTYRAAEELGYDMDYVVAQKEWASDHSSFNDGGMPAVGYILSTSPTSLETEHVYHTINDNMDNFSRDRLEKSVDLVATAVYNDATAEFVAYVGEGKNREYYTSMDEAKTAARAKGTKAVPMVDIEVEIIYPQLSEDANLFLSELDYEAMEADLTYLTQEIGIRVAGTQAERDAQDYVLGIFEELGYETSLQEFNTARNGVSTNAIGVKKAAVETDLTIYISAHIDTVSPSPGANDNGSGVVGMLGLARALADVDTNYNIVFISCGAEETGKEGSYAFAQAMTEEQRANAICDYNLDMIATSQEDVIYIMMMTSDGKENHASLMAREAALSLEYSDEQFHTCQGTPADHDNFHKVGIPAVQFFRLKNNTSFSYGAVESNYHTASDNMNQNFSIIRLKEIMDAVGLAVYNDATADYVAVVGEGTSREYYTTVAEAMSASTVSGAQVTLLSTGEVLTYSHSCKLADGSTTTIDKVILATEIPGGKTITLESGHYFLAEDVTTNVTFEIKGDVHICLNGYTINFDLSSAEGEDQKGGFYVNGGTLSITDICSNAAGLITASSDSPADGMSPIRVAGGGALSLNKVYVQDSTCAGIAVQDSTSNVTLTHSNVSGAQYGIVNEGVLTISGGNIDGSVYGIKNEGALSVENCYIGYGRTAVRYEAGEVIFMPFSEGTTAADISLWGTINGCNATIDTNRGVMYGNITKTDPYIPMYYNKGVDLNYVIKSGDILEMRQLTSGLSRTDVTDVESFWITNISGNSNYHADYGREGQMTHNTGTYQTVVYNKKYKGNSERVGATLKKIRLDPVATHDTLTSGYFEYDYVYFGPEDRSPANIMASVDKADYGVYNAQGSTFTLGNYVEIYGSDTDIYLGKGVVVTINGSVALPEDGTISVQTEANPDDGAIRLTSGWPADRDVSVINYIPSGNVTVDYSVTKIGADVYVLSTESVSHKHCVYGENCEFLKAGTDCTHSIVSYSTPLYSGNFATAIDAAGTYYLDDDVALTGELKLDCGGEIYLCLNGHRITGNQMLVLSGSTKLYLCNCKREKDTDGTFYIHRATVDGELWLHSGNLIMNSTSSSTMKYGKLVVDGGNFIADPGTGTEEANVYVNVTLSNAEIILRSGSVVNYGANGAAACHAGTGHVIMDGDISLTGGSAIADIWLFPATSSTPLYITIREGFDPKGQVYTVRQDVKTLSVREKYQLTFGWGQYASHVDYIPFECVRGYEIVELEENGVKELYMIRPEDHNWFVPHYHYLDNGEVIYFDQKLTQEVWNSCGGYVPAGNYILCESISGEPGDFPSFGYGGPHEGTTSYICLCGFDITTAERLHMYSGSTLHFVDCTEDPEKVGKFTVGHISCTAPATVILENIKGEFNATNWGIGADSKLIMKDCQTTYSGTSCGIGGAAEGWTAEIDGGTFTSVDGPCFDLDSVGKFTLGGSLIVNSGEKADFVVYSDTYIAFDANNPLTPPAGETYVVQLSGMAPTEDTPVRITDGWKNSGLASTATSEAKIPFVSSQGYVIRELTVNGVTELYVTLVEITAQVNDTTMGQVSVIPDLAAAGTTVTVTATAKGDYGLNTVSYTYTNGTETVTKMVTMGARDADGNYVGTFTLPNTTGDVTVYAVFGTPHVHKLANGETITFERAITKEILEAYNYSLPAGNYYLAEDIALERGLDLGNKHVCLNDHAITGYKDVNVSYCTVYDCKDSGVIETSSKVASNFYFKGGTIYSNCANGLYVQTGVQSFEGGTFIGSPDSGSTTTYGGGTVDNGKDIRLIGGKIVNTSGLGAVAHIGLGTVTLDGDFEIESATGANFYILQAYNKSTALLTIGPNFAPNGKVYTVKYDASIASRTKRQLTSGWGANASDLGYIPFESVDGFEIVELEENGVKELYLIRPEDHTWFVPHYHTLDNGEVIYFDQKLTQEIWTANGYGTTIPSGNYVLCDDIVLGGSTYFQGYTATNANVNICLCGHYFGAEGVEWNFGTNSYIRVDDCTTDDTMLGTFAFGQIWATSNTNATIVFANGNFTSYGSRSWSMASYGDFHMEGGYFTSSANSVCFGPIRSNDNTYYIAGGTIICTGAAVADLDVKAVYFSGSPIVTGKGYDFEFYAHGLFTFVEGKPLTPPEGETYILHTSASVTADKPVQLTKDWKYSGLASTTTEDAKIPFVSNQGYVVKEMTVNGVTELYLAVPEVTVAPNITGGTVAVNPVGGLQDTTITVTATPNQGKALRYVTYSYLDGDETVTRLVETNMMDSGAYVGTFAMPAADAVVTAYFGDPHTHDGVTFETLASVGGEKDIYPILAQGGRYVLDGDGEFVMDQPASGTMTLSEEVYLCLNGRELELNQLYVTGKLYICNCTGHGKLDMRTMDAFINLNSSSADVTIKNVTIEKVGGDTQYTPIYMYAGSTKLHLENCSFTGASQRTSLGVQNYITSATIKNASLHNTGSGTALNVEVNGFTLSGYNIFKADNNADIKIWHENGHTSLLNLTSDFDPAPNGKTAQTYTLALDATARNALANGPVQITSGWSVAKSTNSIDYIPFVYYDETNKNAPFASDYIVFEKGNELYVGLRGDITVETEGEGSAVAKDEYGKVITYTGETATVKIDGTPAEGYVASDMVLTYTVDGKEVKEYYLPNEQGDFSFTMPSTAVTATVSFYEIHEHPDGTKFYPLTQNILNTVPSNTGLPEKNYYLVDNGADGKGITTIGKLKQEGGPLSICLYGHKLTINGQLETLGSNTVLEFYDCTCVGADHVNCEGTGEVILNSDIHICAASAIKIFGGHFTSKSSNYSMYIVTDGRFYMEGGSLKFSDTQSFGSPVMVDGGMNKSFYLRGGELICDTYPTFNTEALRTYMSGTPRVSGKGSDFEIVNSGNYKTLLSFEDGKPLTPPAGVVYRISATATPNSDPVIITSGWKKAGLSTIPFVNTQGYAIREINNELYLVVPELTVNVNDPNMGSASADVLSGVAGTPVTVTATPVSDKYYVSSVVLTYWNGAETVTEELEFTTDENGVATANLTMPAADAKVTVNFKKYHVHTMSTDCSLSENGAENIIFATELNKDNIQSYRNGYELQPGYYVLTSDITIDMIYIPGDVYICLNGYTITYSERNTGVQVNADALHVCDCSEGKSGTFTTNSTNTKNVLVRVWSGTTNIYGGNYTTNRNYALYNVNNLNVYGGSVSALSAAIAQGSGTLTVSGGTITSITTGVEFENGTFNLSGNPVINGTKQDILLYEGKTITINGLLTPPQGETYSVRLNGTKPTVGHPIQITEGFAENGNTYNCFTSADPNYFTYVKNGEVYLGVKANITVQTEGEGTAVAKDANGNEISVALETDTVKIDATPANGHFAGRLVLTYMEGETEVTKELVPDEQGDFEFSMPSASVTATVYFYEPHIHTLADGTQIVYDKVLTEAMLKQNGGVIQDGNYFLIEDCEISTKVHIAYGNTVHLCLLGHDINTNRHDLFIAEKAYFRLDDCVGDSLVSLYKVELDLQNVDADYAVFVLAGGNLDCSAANFNGNAVWVCGNFIMEGGSLTCAQWGPCGTALGTGAQQQYYYVKDMYLKGGTITAVSSAVEVCVGKTYLEGSIIINSLEAEDFAIYPDYYDQYLYFSGKFTPPAGETYTVTHDGVNASNLPYRLTEGWDIADCDTIPFVSTQGYAIREITDENGKTELYLCIPEVTLNVNDDTKGSAFVDPTAGKENTDITVTATPNENKLLRPVTMTYWNGAETVTQTLEMVKDENGTYTGTFKMPAADVTVNVVFEDPHTHPLTEGMEDTLFMIELDRNNLESYLVRDGSKVYLTGGNYVLLDDITVPDTIIIDETVNLCLNGHSMNFGTNELTINGTLNVCDCSEGETGSFNPYKTMNNEGAFFRIYSGKVTTDTTTEGYMLVAGGSLIERSGSKMIVHNKGTLEITGGYLKANGPYGIYSYSSSASDRVLRITGGTIDGGTTATVYVGNTEFYFGGEPILTKSTDIYLAAQGQTIIIDSPVTGGSYTINGTKTYFEQTLPIRITENWDDNKTDPIPFTSKKDEYVIFEKDGELYFGVEQAINIQVEGNGTAVAKNTAGNVITKAVETFTVFIDGTPAEGQSMARVVLTYMDGETEVKQYIKPDADGNYTFAMPGADVNVLVTFMQTHIHTLENGEKIVFDKYVFEEGLDTYFANGNYVLVENVTTTSGIYFDGNVNICLCGKNFSVETLGHSGQNNVIYDCTNEGVLDQTKEGHKLTPYQSSLELNGGKLITRPNNDAFAVQNRGHVTVSGGTFYSTQHGMINWGSGYKLTVTGGTLIADNSAGTVVVLGYDSFEMMGSPIITGGNLDFDLANKSFPGTPIQVIGKIEAPEGETYIIGAENGPDVLGHPVQFTNNWSVYNTNDNIPFVGKVYAVRAFTDENGKTELYLVVPELNVEVNDPSMGSASANVTGGVKDTPATVTATVASDDYYLSSMVMTYWNGLETVTETLSFVNNGDGTYTADLTMPAADVTVKVNFEKKHIHEDDGMKFDVPVTAKNIKTVINQGGYLYLTEDIEVNLGYISNGTKVYLCLNGHKITSGTTGFYGDMYICDCSGHGEFETSYFFVGSQSKASTLTLAGGKLISKSVNGIYSVSAVYGTSTFILEGGTLVSYCGTSDNGGSAIESSCNGGSIILNSGSIVNMGNGGCVEIWDSKDKIVLNSAITMTTEKGPNFWLGDGNVITIGATFAPGEDVSYSVGVLETGFPVRITTGWSVAKAENNITHIPFTSHDPDYFVYEYQGELWLGNPHYHYMAVNTTEGDGTGDKVPFVTELDSVETLNRYIVDGVLQPGNYVVTAEVIEYLESNVEITINSGDVNLCLNGNTLDLGTSSFNIGARSSEPFTVGVLNICDCQGDGKLTSENENNTIRVIATEGALNLYSGTVENDNSTGGSSFLSAVRVSYGTANIYGGKVEGRHKSAIHLENGGILNISGGTVTATETNGIGVNFRNGTFNLSGAPVITGGQNGAGIYLASGKTINIDGAVTAPVGAYSVKPGSTATEKMPVQITTGWNVADANKVLTSYPFVHYNAPANYSVWKIKHGEVTDYELYFAVAHKHEIKDENGNVIDTIVYDKALTQDNWDEYYYSNGEFSYLNGGNYVLIEDIHVEHFIQSKENPTVNICLCGNDMTIDNNASVRTENYVSIVDCTEDKDEIGTLTASYLYGGPCDLYMENIKVNLVGPGFGSYNIGVTLGGKAVMKDVYLTCSGADYGFVTGDASPDVRLIGGSYTFNDGYAIDLDDYESFVMGGELVITGKDDLDFVIYDNAYISFDQEYPLAPPAGETYTVLSEVAITTDNPVRITSGWADSGLTEIPFVSYDGYVVEELFCEATGMKELYLTMPTVTTQVETEGTGDLVADPTATPGGTTVTLTATPAEGYMVEKVVLTYVLNGEEVTETLAMPGGVNTFTMPAAHVTATATFRPLHIHEDGMVFDIVFTEELFAYYNGNIPAGNYVVMDSLTMGELRFNKGGEVNFCLCGQEVYNAESIACGGTRANIYDCIGTATWSSSKFAVDSTNGSGAQFYFYGGTLTGRTNTSGGGGSFTVRDSRGRMVVDGATVIGVAGYWATTSVGDYNNGSYKGTITFVSGKIINKGGDGTVELDKLNGRVEMEGSFILDCEKDGPEINLYGNGPLLTITGPMDPPVIDGVRETYTLTSHDKKPTWTAPVQFTEGWGNYDHGGYIPFVSYQGYAVREIETTYTNSYGETVTLKELFLCYVAEQTVDLNLWKEKEITVSAETMIEGIIACDPNHRFFADNGDYTVTGIQNHTMPVLSVEATEEGFLLNGSEVGTFTGDLVITYTDNGNGKTGTIIVPITANIYDVQNSVFVLDYAKDIKLTDHLFDADTLPGTGEGGNMILNVESYAQTVTHVNENGTFLAVEGSDGKGTYGTFLINEAGKAIYDPDENAMMDGTDKIHVVFRAVENSAEASELGIMNPFKEVEMFKEIVVIPANVVYYEDTHAAMNWNPQNNSGIVIETIGKPAGDGYQDGDSSSEYGNDSDYADAPEGEYTGSGGTRKVITVTANGPVLTFTFKGTGFDLLGSTTADSGQFMYKVFTGTDTTTNTNVVVMGGVETSYGQWDTATPAGDEAIHEVPLIHVQDLSYGTYTVLVQAVANYDWYAPVDKWVNGLPPVEEIHLYFDGIRVYNPIAMDAEDREYYIDGEDTAEFIQLRGMILNGQAASAKFDAEGNFSFGTGLISYVEKDKDGLTYKGNTVSSLKDYLIAGPNNEVYFNETTQSLVLFVKKDGSEDGMLQLGIRNLNPEAFDNADGDGKLAPVFEVLGAGGETVQALTTEDKAISYTEQYYTINYKDCVVDTLNGENYYRVVITAKNGSAISLSNLKVSGLEFYTMPGQSADYKYDENGNLVETTNAAMTFAMPNLRKIARQIMAANGMLPEDELPVEDAELMFRSISLSLQSSIGMNLYVAKSTLEGYSDPYVMLSKTVYDANGNASQQTVKLDTYVEATVSGQECIVFVYNDISAKEMNSNVNVQLFATKNDTIRVMAGESRDYSVVQYAKNMLNRNISPALNTLLVDMVNYGTEAQLYFGYNTANLANADFEAYQSFATVEAPVLGSCAVKDAPNEFASFPEGGQYLVNVAGASLLLEDKVKPNIFVEAKDAEGNLNEGRTLMVAYENVNGETIFKEILITAKYLDSKGQYYRVTFDSLNATDLRTPFLAWVTEDGQRISNTMCYSIESYVASIMGNTAAAAVKMHSVIIAMMKYGDAAKAYFGDSQ